MLFFVWVTSSRGFLVFKFTQSLFLVIGRHRLLIREDFLSLIYSVTHFYHWSSCSTQRGPEFRFSFLIHLFLKDPVDRELF